MDGMNKSENLATNTVAIASSSPSIKKVNENVNYIVDLVFILLFLYVLIFIKPDKNLEKNEELSEEEKPNPLEKVLRTDSDEEKEKNE